QQMSEEEEPGAGLVGLAHGADGSDDDENEEQRIRSRHIGLQRRIDFLRLQQKGDDADEKEDHRRRESIDQQFEERGLMPEEIGKAERASSAECEYGNERGGDRADDRKADEPVQYKPDGPPGCA